MDKIYTTPGVYIEEKSAFPNSVVKVPSAVPAFIGYTEKAIQNKKNITNVPTRISSLNEYLLYFGGAPKTTFEIRETFENPPFELKESAKKFYLFYSMKLFFNNGGSDCYIVSIGNYQNEVQTDHFFGFSSDRAAVGLNTLEKHLEPTLVLAPDTMLLEDPSSVQTKILQHCGSVMKNRFAILDIPKGYQARKVGDDNDLINSFRKNIGTNFLDFGAAYYPWVETSITSKSEINFEYIHPDFLNEFIKILNKDTAAKLDAGSLNKAQAAGITAQVNEIQTISQKPITEESNKQTIHTTLLQVHPLYKEIIGNIVDRLNLLPPSGAIAGIYNTIDNNIGVFQSPANVSIASVIRPAVAINDEDQEDLNLPLNGKAVNAIRQFPGKGTLVWGARTLDGNSLDWKYISVRRTVIMIEQSVKNAAQVYVFEPNTSATWQRLNAMLTNFLTNVWYSGALVGATPADAFSVDVGLGVTMTPVDILEGIMRISIKLAVTRPAEFIIITFEQQMQKS